MPRHRGFTMIEMVAAGAMLVVLLAVSMQFFQASAVHRRMTRQRELAIQEVANLMERLAAIPWQDLTAEKANQVQLSELARNSLPGAQLTIEVSQPAEKPSDGKAAAKPVAAKAADGKPSLEEPPAKRILVALAWEDASRRLGQPIRLTAWRYRNGGGN